MWRALLKISNIQGIVTTLRLSSKQSTFLGIHTYRTRLERNPKQTACCIFSIPYECGKRYAGETSISANIGINLRHLHEKSKLAQHAYAGSLSVGLDKARISEIRSNRRYKKYHKSALNTLFGNLPHTSKEAGNL